MSRYARVVNATQSVQQRLEADIQFLDSYNRLAVATNARVLPVLEQSTGLDLGDDAKGWRAWWYDEIGLQEFRQQDSAGRPTVTQRVSVGVYLGSCFAAGTPVWTDRGPVAIERLQMGDLVLSQDEATGALAYRPILKAHHNPPSETLRIVIDGEAIVSSAFHRFWRVGEGWAMARDLEPGDVVRALGRTAAIASIEPDEKQPVFNLDVDGTRSFFVGESAALVHDNSLPEPGRSPFDRVADLAAVVSPATAGE